MRHGKTILCVLLGVMLVCTSMMAADQQQAKQKRLMIKKPVVMPMVKVKLVCNASKFMGKCPVTVMMDGKISSTGPITVKYYFKRSDGARPRLATLPFRRRETKTIPFRWSLGVNGTYWVQLVVKVGTKEIKSNKIGFEVDCQKAKTIKPQIGKIDWKIVKKPFKLKAPKLTIQKGYIAQLIPNVDLRVNRVAATPRRIRRYVGRVYIYVHVANGGKSPSPACKLAIRMKAQYRHPQHGDFFEWKYDIPALSPGAGGWVRYPFHKFWRGRWTVSVKIDANNSVAEVGKEGNNVYPRGGAPRVYFLVY